VCTEKNKIREKIENREKAGRNVRLGTFLKETARQK
jgi:hypothetical protein